MRRLVLKDKKKRQNFRLFEQKRKVLKYLEYSNPKYLWEDNNWRISSQLFNFKRKKQFSKVEARNRCLITLRSRSVYRKFKLNRNFLKKYASLGLIPGLKKISW